MITVLWKIKKKSGKNKNKLRTIYPKNHEHLKILRSNFTGSFKIYSLSLTLLNILHTLSFITLRKNVFLANLVIAF